MRRSLLTAALLCLMVIPDAVYSEPASPATYHVRKGDSLSLIANRFGTTVATLMRDNSLSGDIIHVGQTLSLSRPFQGMERRSVRWGRPVRNPGPVLRPFGPYKAGGILMPRTGIELACAAGTRLYSPAIGIVRHSGTMEGFGHLLIIEHPGRYATVLTPFDPGSLVVTVGQAVLRGDHLGKTDRSTADGAKPYVHIELRRNDKAIPPDRLIK